MKAQQPKTLKVSTYLLTPLLLGGYYLTNWNIFLVVYCATGIIAFLAVCFAFAMFRNLRKTQKPVYDDIITKAASKYRWWSIPIALIWNIGTPAALIYMGCTVSSIISILVSLASVAATAYIHDEANLLKNSNGLG